MIYQVKNINGNVYWHVDGKRHRLDGPAIELANGHREWFVDGQRHRLDGPAVEWINERRFWFVNGKYLTESEFNDLSN